MLQFTVTSDERLEGSIDVEVLAEDYPRDYTVKGMFITRFTDALGPDWKALEKVLIAPPRLGRYLPFQNYPQVDYARLCLAVAAKRFPRLSAREAVRRIARDDLATFAASMIGKVVLALAGDARSTLLRVPDSYARVTTGARVTAVELDATTVRAEFHGYNGLPEYTLGQLEGVVLHYGGAPTTAVRELGTAHLAFDVRHRT